MTHYRYRKCHVDAKRSTQSLEIEISSANTEADLSVRAVIDKAAAEPPEGSPFPDLKLARRYAGPLPFTFSYEAESGRMIVVEGVRRNWKPMPVHAEIEHCTFIEKAPFSGYPARLANAFYVEDISYRWNFLAYGPGAFHFVSRRTWLSTFSSAGLKLNREANCTPFVRVFELRNSA